ncbi:dihydrofolate reductase [Glutamicibacter protophormiae]|uniref:dihydrofolate reductase n=1 Tax=Kocuria varians TaxID=1272 RepID=A0A7D7Q441_KOCVA|nr:MULTISPECIES: dihydrofolate reductase [Kocuria]QMS55440.1 Dihydrofolate reductase [Kocuria varians]WNB89048.1 dihydrofolate reductase [Glutamicibacter protophormiae]
MSARGTSRQPVVGGIWAQTPGGVIGVDGGIPWHLSEDLKFFARTTIGHPVVMGRRTWESFPERFRPLPGRPNIVVTSHPESVPADGEHVWAVDSYDAALRLAVSLTEDPPAGKDGASSPGHAPDGSRGAESASGVVGSRAGDGADAPEPAREIWVIGGPRVWREAAAHPALPLTRVLVTTVEMDVPGDTHAPALDAAWHRTQVEDWTVAGNGTRFRIDEYVREPMG